MSYWWWYLQIAGTVPFYGPAVAQGGTWGDAVEIMPCYGVMNEGAFIAEEATAQRSNPGTAGGSY